MVINFNGYGSADPRVLQAKKNLSKLIGKVINDELNAPPILKDICHFETAEPGEKVWRFDAYDTDVDQFLDLDPSTHYISPVKRSPVGDTELTFKGLMSQQEYVTVTDAVRYADTQLFTRKKERIAKTVDKLELRCVLNAILDGKTPGMIGGTHDMEDAITATTPTSGNDIYDILLAAKFTIQDYSGGGYELLVGTAVNQGIEKYNKGKASTHNYKVDIYEEMRNWKMNLTEVPADCKVKWTSGTGLTNLHNIGAGGYADDSTAQPLLNTNKLVLVGKKSTLHDGYPEPIVFVRQKLTPEMSSILGLEIDQETYRAKMFIGPVYVGGTGVVGFSILVFELGVWAVTNSKQITKTADISAYL